MSSIPFLLLFLFFKNCVTGTRQLKSKLVNDEIKNGPDRYVLCLQWLIMINLNFNPKISELRQECDLIYKKYETYGIVKSEETRPGDLLEVFEAPTNFCAYMCVCVYAF